MRRAAALLLLLAAASIALSACGGGRRAAAPAEPFDAARTVQGGELRPVMRAQQLHGALRRGVRGVGAAACRE